MEFTISFDINIQQIKYIGYVALVHFTTGQNSGEYGSEMPKIWTVGNQLQFYQSASSSTSLKVCDLDGTIDSPQNVAYKHTKRSDGKFWIEVLLDGELKCEYENTTPTCMENMKFYASNPWNGVPVTKDQTPVTINKFKIITGKLDSNTIR